MEDWDRAQALIHYELSLKLGFWKTLPYVVFGLGDDDEDEARAACAQSVTMYDMLLDSDERDWFTEFMLSPKSDMGQQLREFASGEKALMELPLLQEERVIAQCVPITEESIEGKHAIVNRGIRHAGHVSPAYVSATVLRGGEIEDHITADPFVFAYVGSQHGRFMADDNGSTHRNLTAPGFTTESQRWHSQKP